MLLFDIKSHNLSSKFTISEHILSIFDAEKPNNQIAVTVQNLALAMYGMLTNHLFDYNQNGIQKKSISFPRPSYDGHFLCYTLSDYGQFSIWHHEAETSIQKEMSARPLCCPSEIRAVSTLSAFFPSMCQIS